MGETQGGQQPFGHEGTPGSPLPATVRHEMEVRFGSDLSDVKVHPSSPAAYHEKKAAEGAFTCGSDIYFSAGKYNPTTEDGKALLAHELAHVAQQRGGDPGR